jgi:hypothetical protein
MPLQGGTKSWRLGLVVGSFVVRLVLAVVEYATPHVLQSYISVVSAPPCVVVLCSTAIPAASSCSALPSFSWHSIPPSIAIFQLSLILAYKRLSLLSSRLSLPTLTYPLVYIFEPPSHPFPRPIRLSLINSLIQPRVLPLPPCSILCT